MGYTQRHHRRSKGTAVRAVPPGIYSARAVNPNTAKEDTVGSQFSEEFLLGYRAGHRDGFADAVQLMRDAATADSRSRALARREDQLGRLLSGNGLLPETLPEGKQAERNRTGEASLSKESR